MKRGRQLSALIMGLCLLLFSGCGAKLGTEFTQEVNTLEGAELLVDGDLVTPEGLTFSVNNQSDRDLNYGQDYGLQKEENGSWYQIEPKRQVAVTLELLWTPAGSTDTYEINWSASYGKLSSGHYRLIKSVADNENSYYLAGEFDIE